NQTGEKIGALQCDGDGEYIGNEFRHFLTEFGIELCMSTRNHPQQNGVAERANRILGDAVVAMLTESGLSKKFWCEAVAAYVHVWNRVPTSAVPNTTPFEVWYRKKPDVGHLRVWGCVAYVHIQRDKRDKLGSHMEKCIFIGYPDGIKGWKFYNPTTHKVVISERADFDERYTYKSFGTTLVDIPDTSWQARESTPAISLDSEDSEEDKLYDSDTEEEANVVREVEPTTWTEAMNGPYAEQWKEACLEEIKAHMENGTWTVEDLPEQEKAIGSKWVFKIKHNADGSIERFKAHIVAKGFSQRP